MVLMRIRVYYSPIAGVSNLTCMCSAGIYGENIASMVWTHIKSHIWIHHP